MRWRTAPVRAARTDLERWCLGKIQLIVGLDDIDPDDDLFAVGLDSLSVLELCAAIADAGLGEIDLTIPEHVGARIMITRGALSDVEILNERLQALDAKRYATSDFETASAQVEIKIEPGSGDVIIR